MSRVDVQGCDLHALGTYSPKPKHWTAFVTFDSGGPPRLLNFLAFLDRYVTTVAQQLLAVRYTLVNRV